MSWFNTKAGSALISMYCPVLVLLLFVLLLRNVPVDSCGNITYRTHKCSAA